MIKIDVWKKQTYTVLHMFTHVFFWAGNQGNHQNFDLSLTDFHGDEANKMFFEKKKNQNCWLKKTEFFKTTILNIFSRTF